MQPNYPYGPPGQSQAPQSHDYEFILSPNQQSRRGPDLLPSGAPLPLRIVIVVAGIIILLIVFTLVKGLLSGGGNKDALLSVAQQQQEIVHLVKKASLQNNLSSGNLAFSVTAQATVRSDQKQLLAYMNKNHLKVSQKELNLKVSSTLDKQLETASTNSTYNDTYRETMQSQLKDYQQALQTAYRQTYGPKGRKLLNDEFKSSNLLLQQLNEPAL